MISEQARQAVLQIYLPSLVMALGIGMIVPAVPLLGQTFGVSMGLAAQVVTAQVLGRAAALIPSGVLLDRTGFRMGMVVGASIAVISALATAFAASFWMILLSQFCWGVGLTLWRLGRELAAIDLVRVDQRGRQMSALFGIHASGTALGPALGGIILDIWGFRRLFLIFAAMAAVVLIISATVPEQRERTAGTGRKLLDFARLSQIEPYFRGTYLVLILATFGAMLRSEVLNSMLPIYVVDELGYSATRAGFLFFLIGAITFVMIVPAGVISDKYGRKWATVPPALLSGVAFAAFPMATAATGLVILAVMLGIANGMALGSMTTYTYDIVPHRTRAQLQAMRRTIGEAGAFIGPLLGGIVADAYSAAMAFLFFAPLHLLAALLLMAAAKESLPGRAGRKRP